MKKIMSLPDRVARLERLIVQLTEAIEHDWSNFNPTDKAAYRDRILAIRAEIKK